MEYDPMYWLCPCCALAATNDETSGCEHYDGDHSEWLLSRLQVDGMVVATDESQPWQQGRYCDGCGDGLDADRPSQATLISGPVLLSYTTIRG